MRVSHWVDKYFIQIMYFAWENEIHYSLSAWFLSLCPITTTSDIHFWDVLEVIHFSSHKEAEITSKSMSITLSNQTITYSTATYMVHGCYNQRKSVVCRDIKTRGSPKSLTYFGQYILSLSDPLNLNPCLQPPLTITLIT